MHNSKITDLPWAFPDASLDAKPNAHYFEPTQTDFDLLEVTFEDTPAPRRMNSLAPRIVEDRDG